MIVIDTKLVQDLIKTQFPQWADLPIAPAQPQGWDNRTFRLGNALSVRLPSAEGYVPQVAMEHRWLPYLAPRLPLPIPLPIALGQPSKAYPFPWSVYPWLDGQPAGIAQLTDLTALANDLGTFLTALQTVEIPDDAPLPGSHNGYRGGALSTYDAETRRCIETLRLEIDTNAALKIWEAALATTWHDLPVWFHGDVAVNNLLVQNNRLVAVIDFGCAAVGDPACDLVIAWTLFSGNSRLAFENAIQLDKATWIRARGWALWKALLVLLDSRESNLIIAREARRILAEILSDMQPSEPLYPKL
jgi:aminoglycoside phosphotransferase (APT) family kinase protein